MPIKDRLSQLKADVLRVVTGNNPDAPDEYAVHSPHGNKTHWVTEKGKKVESLCRCVWSIDDKLKKVPGENVGCDVCQGILNQQKAAKKAAQKAKAAAQAVPVKNAAPASVQALRESTLIDYTSLYNRLQESEDHPQRGKPLDAIFYGIVKWEESNEAHYHLFRVFEGASEGDDLVLTQRVVTEGYVGSNQVRDIIMQDLYDRIPIEVWLAAETLKDAIDRIVKESGGTVQIDDSLKAAVARSQQ